MTPNDIEPIHRIAYEHGADPIEHAVANIAIHIEVSDAVLAGDVHPGQPISKLPHDCDAVSRRIVGALIDAGWTPPDAATIRRGHDPEACAGCRLDRNRGTR